MQRAAMGEERQICCGFAFNTWEKSLGSSSSSQCGSWWIPGAFPVSDSISSSALALALGRISAGAQQGQESVRAHPQQDPAETRAARTFLRAVTAAGSWLPPQGPCPLPQVWGQEALKPLLQHGSDSIERSI